MRLSVIVLIVAFALGLVGIEAQSTSVSVLNTGGLDFSFTPNGQFMVFARYEVSTGESASNWPRLYIDVYRVDPFLLEGTYPLGEINPDGTETLELVAINRDARLIAFVQSGGLYLLDRQTGAITQETANFYEFEALEFNPVNNLLAYVIGRGITVMDPDDPAIRYELLDDVYGGRISSVAWSLDGRYLANGVHRPGSDTFDVLLWDVTSLDEPIVYEPTVALEGAEPNHVAWRDANTLAAFGEAGIMIYDIPTRSMMAFIENPDGLVWSDGGWSPDGTKLIAAGVNRASGQRVAALQIWNVSNLPNHETVGDEQRVYAENINWLDSGLFYDSGAGLRINGEPLAPQLTATAQAIPTYRATPTETPSPTLTPAP